eukprot:TRINITY_DN9385_c0_g1_i1.p1 TRINITY_DN9385_c0_g1~~TRINITY_DN9385_c0_g1_i1.p1  ORF type:complete len:296 (-),score=93.99 TRINITY_DN9385_c0_g1_i1:1361-2248(-)
MLKDRIQGCFFGLMAGDKNGGPQRLALRVARSLKENNNMLEIDDVVQKYAHWFVGPPFDTSTAFDTGNCFINVFSNLVDNREYSKMKNPKLDIIFSANKIAKKYNMRSAGIGAAHRSVAIGCTNYDYDPDKLISDVREECEITHPNNLSILASITVNLIINKIISGEDFEESVNQTKQKLQELEDFPNDDIVTITNSLEPGAVFDATGYAPRVLAAAFSFLRDSNNFDDCMADSLAFAGSPNYCPVICGSIAGAIYGYENIKDSDELNHPLVDEDICEEFKELSQNISSTYDSLL